FLASETAARPCSTADRASTASVETGTMVSRKILVFTPNLSSISTSLLPTSRRLRESCPSVVAPGGRAPELRWPATGRLRSGVFRPGASQLPGAQRQDVLRAQHAVDVEEEPDAPARLGHAENAARVHVGPEAGHVLDLLLRDVEHLAHPVHDDADLRPCRLHHHDARLPGRLSRLHPA